MVRVVRGWFPVCVCVGKMMMCVFLYRTKRAVLGLLSNAGHAVVVIIF